MSTEVKATYLWMDRVEGLVDRAHAILVGRENGDLSEYTEGMEAAYQERSGLSGTPEMTPQLAALQQHVKLLRSLLRQAQMFAEAREQETGRVLGYTPNGLERAL